MIYIFFKITLTKVSNANIYIHKQFYISFKIILNNRFLVFKIQGLYCHELFFCKWVNLQNPDIGIKVRMKSYDESCMRTGQSKLLEIGALR